MQQESDRLRQSIRSFMSVRGLKVHPWSVKAGVAPSSLRNFLKGRSSNLTRETLIKLANAANDSIGVLVGADTDPLKGDNKRMKITQTDDGKARLPTLLDLLEMMAKIEQRLSAIEKNLRALDENQKR